MFNILLFIIFAEKVQEKALHHSEHRFHHLGNHCSGDCIESQEMNSVAGPTRRAFSRSQLLDDAFWELFRNL